MIYTISTTLFNGDEAFDVILEVDADCSYAPEYTSGLPENCYPDESYCEIYEVRVIESCDVYAKWLHSLIGEPEMDRVEELVWELFMELENDNPI